ncbi:MAG: hydantoinase B/oxoprolinase family protein [Deltaproteobacteria bacterium]|nr:hydantoinase B/oxoprolinase family protein [Deltaproteobacteria bacterium]
MGRVDVDETPGPARWELWIDRGGTFTDCIARAPDGRLLTHKLLSSESAPVEGIRALLEADGAVAPGAALPPCDVKLGSTVATNALLERRGAPTLLVADRGLGDVPTIGTQERPELFELDIRKPLPLHAAVVECDARTAVDGSVAGELDEAALRAELVAAQARGLTSVAVVLIHAYAYPELELRVAAIAAELGFDHVVCSHAVAREMGLLARGETSIADAYLTPLLQRHVTLLAAALPGSQLRFMQSSGGLTDRGRFRGPRALLSGPAGGVVAAARVASRAGYADAIGFDMGGTSTDVSLIHRGEVERAFETLVAGVRVRSPMLRIHTVAAGGGSLCRFDGFRLTVGPESAGSRPGPLCYLLHDEQGEPLAHELALTDINLVLGRVQPDRFPFPVERAPALAALAALHVEITNAGFERTLDEIAAGFVEIANAAMAQAIEQVSVSRGVDPRGHVLVGFGGAGGQHVCGIARELGMRTILLHRLAGLLSAYGIGVADVTWDGEQDAGRVELPESGAMLPEAVDAALRALDARGRAALREEGAEPSLVRVERWLDLRYAGTETPLSIRQPEGQAPGAWREAFTQEHARRFGYVRGERGIEIVTVRVRAIASSPTHADAHPDRQPDRGDRPAAPAGQPAPPPERHEEVYFTEHGRVPTPVYRREALVPGVVLEGPAVILEDIGTVVLDPGWRLSVDGEGMLVLHDHEEAHVVQTRDLVQADPVRLEVFGNRFMSMAEQMGAVLRNTAVSTNIKERLDYSCAVFDREGGLVANAPHIPVHLGAMGATVRAVRKRFPELAAGDVVVTNDPAEGGSHLPDVTVVTPVFVGGRDEPDFFVASRGHHADIGGITPGSMPPDSTTLEDEGVVLHAFKLVQGGHFEEAQVRRLLAAGPHPARRPDDNVADLVAMLAANRAGEQLLREFVDGQGIRAVTVTMGQLQRASAAKVAHEIGRLPDGEHGFVDRMDDGTPVQVRLRVSGERMRVDFEGTGAASRHNLNAPPAVVEAAVIYVLRSLVAQRIPLNGGCLEPVEIRIPTGCLLDPPPGSAVVGGNVETSQRIVDVLLGALGLVAASQGTMNNVTFGNTEFGYYETIGGGAGAGRDFDGASGVHTHMTNTRITDPEVLEARYPVQLETFALRRGSGGAGRRRGGDGLVRGYRFLAEVTVSLLTERRDVPPWGLSGGEPGACGRNFVVHADGTHRALPAKCSLTLQRGDRLFVETPGGGGYGQADTRGRP